MVIQMDNVPTQTLWRKCRVCPTILCECDNQGSISGQQCPLFLDGNAIGEAGNLKVEAAGWTHNSRASEKDCWAAMPELRVVVFAVGLVVVCS